VHYALGQLHKQYHFDLVEFPVRGGLGFRVIQAKRAGLAFQDVRFIVNLDDATARAWERERRWPNDLDDLDVDFRERYAFERADLQRSQTSELLAWAGRSRWQVRPDAISLSISAGVDALEQSYRDLLQATEPEAELAGHPLVTVAMPHFNFGRYLPEALASLAAQTYSNLEVIAIDDGSTDSHSRQAFEEMRIRYPRFRFLRQENAGIGATRNRGLWEARGEYFIPMDADNVARPDMVERFVSAIQRHPDLAAMTCYFLAFRRSEDLPREDFAYAYRPTGGPFILASVRNVYGDANAIFRTGALRSVGGYETDRDSSWEDWEAFIKLVRSGHPVDVVPEPLFYYRHLDSSFSRVTNPYQNQRRVLRQFFEVDELPAAERIALWLGIAGMQQRLEELEEENRCLKSRRGVRWLLTSGRRAWQKLAGAARGPGNEPAAADGESCPGPLPRLTSR
jgi:glycosyltransferase involved in cell wall biosynthesis